MVIKQLQLDSGHSQAAGIGRIVYSQCWEDPESSRKALRITPDDDLLVITSGGCNVLALSLEHPKSLTAIDGNPAQNHLLELKIAAIHALNYDLFLSFLGIKASADRWELYLTIRNYLSISARAYWDLRKGIIESGIIHSGRFDRYLNLFRRKVLPLVHSRKCVQQLLALEGYEEQQQFYDNVWNNRRWRLLFRVFFGRYLMGRLGRYPEFFKYVDTDNVSAQYLERTRHALTEIPIRGNYFLEYILTGNYIDHNWMPPYLMECNFESLKKLSGKIEIITDTLESYLAKAEESSISKFYLSDIFELAPQDEYERVLKQLVYVSRSGGRLCYYNNLVPRSHPMSLDEVISEESELGRKLHYEDRSFVYQRFVVEQVIK